MKLLGNTGLRMWPFGMGGMDDVDGDDTAAPLVDPDMA